MRSFVCWLALILVAVVPALADDLASAREVISGQADAFSRDDALAAYAYAAPNVQTVFPDPDGFLNMVRNGYAPVYRHKSFDFGESDSSDGKIVQRVHIVDAAGVPWEALYTLERIADGSVKITGCVLLKAGQSV